MFCILVFSFQITSAQFAINGELRTKTMLLDGYKQLLSGSQNPYGLIVQRSRLLFDYKKDNMTFGFSVQDIRNWGQDATSTSNNNIGVFEAWAKYNFNENFAIKFGRQQIKYDDERLLSISNWSDQGIVHDLAVFQYDNKAKTLKADLGLAMNNNAGSALFLSDYTVKNYKYLSYLWLNKPFVNNKLDVSLVSILDVNQKPTDANTLNSRFTIGPNINYNIGKLKIGGVFYYQGGKLADGKTVKANFYSAKLNYKITKGIELAVAYDHYSGTDFKDTTIAKTESTTFDKLYGTGHTFLGYMDYFTGNSSDITKGAGVNDLYIRAIFDFKEKHNIEATYHLYNLDKAYVLVSSKASYLIDKNLGSEIDFIYTYKYNKVMNLSLGYCTMLPNESMEYLSKINKGESKFAQFAYLMITLKPNFFTSKD
ncbi:MAG: alginate export family protein [Bacteroidetes bacterium]|nr:alginate export family protein [Bacteroidota bacterium]